MTVPFNGQRPTVVVIGAGFGGLSVVKALRKAPVRVVLLDRNNYHLFQPLLYQVGTALLDPSDIAAPIRPLLRKIRNAEFRLAEVTGVDLDARKVKTDHGDVAYDYLVVSAGARTNFFGNDNVEAHSIGLKNLDDALLLRNELIRRFELAKWEQDGIARRRLLSFVVVGGGSTGVETAGAIVELAKYVMAKDYKSLDIRDVSVTLLEGGDTVLAPYHQKLRNAAAERLRWMGVKVLRASVVTKVDGDLIMLANGNSMRGLLIWTAGVRGEDIGEALSPRLGRQARVPVNSYLQVAGHPDVFCVGDLAEIPGPDRRPLPMLGPVATQSGKHAAKNLVAHMRGKHLEPFRYWDKGTMSTIGRNAAIVQVGKIRITGFIGWVSWLFVHVVLIEGFRGKIGTLTTWLWHYLTNDRPGRLLDGRHWRPDTEEPARPQPEVSATPAPAMPAPQTPGVMPAEMAGAMPGERAEAGAVAEMPAEGAPVAAASTARKATARKSTPRKRAARKSTSRKSTARKTSARKASTAKKAVAADAAAESATPDSAEKPTAKKAVAKKATRKRTAKKTTTQKKAAAKPRATESDADSETAPAKKPAKKIAAPRIAPAPRVEATPSVNGNGAHTSAEPMEASTEEEKA